MFDEVTRREGGKGAARKARFVLGSTVLQALVLAAAVAATAAFGARSADERLVPVTFVPPPPPPPAPDAAPAPGPAGTPMPAARPARVKPPPSAEPTPAPPPPKLVQPSTLPDAMPPVPPPEPEPAQGPGSGDGVVGGAPGGGGGAPVPGASGALGAPGRVVEDAPEDAARRNLDPALADPECMRRSAAREPELELQPELAGRVLEVQFEVSPNGALSAFRTVEADVAGPLKRAMWSALRRCRWTPGTDAEGLPAPRTKRWRFRFE